MVPGAVDHLFIPQASVHSVVSIDVRAMLFDVLLLFAVGYNWLHDVY